MSGDIDRTKLAHQFLEREHFLDRSKISRYRANALAVDAIEFGANRRECFRPRCGTQFAVFANERTIQPLRAQTIDDMARLVGNPFLVHGLVDARQNAHHFASTRIDANGRADRVHHIDGLRLAQLPGSCRERIWLRRQCAHRANID